jgi:hypothetical protein
MNNIIDVILNKRFTFKQKKLILSYRLKVYLKHIWGRRLGNTIRFYFKHKSCFRAKPKSTTITINFCKSRKSV